MSAPSPARTSPARTAQALRQQAGEPRPRIPPLGDLAELGRAYLELLDHGAAPPPAVYVPLDAARAFAQAAKRIHGRTLTEEQAQRYLTELIVGSRPTRAPREGWRVRRDGYDLSLTVAEERGLAVITHVHARPHVAGGSRRGSRRG